MFEVLIVGVCCLFVGYIIGKYERKQIMFEVLVIIIAGVALALIWEEIYENM